jgi:hypothetical protein
MKKLTTDTDLAFGSTEEMLAWCEREKITPVKDANGKWDWHRAWDEYSARLTMDPPNTTDTPA